jgi:hypothetical protein
MTGPQGRGADAVRLAAERYGFDVESARWYDGVGPTGTKYEVKSTNGRGFRVWRDQHRSLTSAASAWYVFVYDGRIVKRRPSTVTRYVRDAGGWVDSGHDRLGGDAGGERYLDPDRPF